MSKKKKKHFDTLCPYLDNYHHMQYPTFKIILVVLSFSYDFISTCCILAVVREKKFPLDLHHMMLLIFLINVSFMCILWVNVWSLKKKGADDQDQVHHHGRQIWYNLIIYIYIYFSFCYFKDSIVRSRACHVAHIVFCLFLIFFMQ